MLAALMIAPMPDRGRAKVACSASLGDRLRGDPPRCSPAGPRLRARRWCDRRGGRGRTYVGMLVVGTGPGDGAAARTRPGRRAAARSRSCPSQRRPVGAVDAEREGDRDDLIATGPVGSAPTR